MKKGFFTIFIVFSLSVSGLFAQEETTSQIEEFSGAEELVVDEALEESAEDFPFLEPVSKKELSDGEKKSSLIIDCDLKSARVYLNGIYQGKTKLRIDDLLPAEYILEVRKDGYKTQKFYISARSSFIHSYKIKLK